MSGEFGAAMKRLRTQRRLTADELARKVSYDRGALGRLERGERLPTPQIAALIDTALNADGHLVRIAEHHRSGVCSHTTPDDLDAAARGSTEFAEWVTATSGRLAVDQIADELTAISRQFVHAAPQPLIGRLTALRGGIRAALQAGPPPSRAQELLLLAGITIDLLAQVTENLGHPRAAEHHARAAEQIAVKIGHRGLRAWAGGTRALIWEWNGRPEEAMRLAGAASALAPVGQQQVRLAAIEARCAARAGHADTAYTAITRARHAAEHSSTDEVTALGGALRFPPHKMAYYLGSTHRLLGDHAHAHRWALHAVEAYERGPAGERSYGDEALARADAAIARITTGELDGATEVLTPVLRLPGDQLIQPVTNGLRAVTTTLHNTGHARHPIGVALGEQITTLTSSLSLAGPA